MNSTNALLYIFALTTLQGTSLKKTFNAYA
jgi:hypothetical protein